MTHGELAVILESHGMRVRARRSGFQAQCPAHLDDKRKRALSIGLGADGRQILHCHAGCTFDAVRNALGLPAEAFFGWHPYNHKRLRRLSPAFSVTLIVRDVSVLNAKSLLSAHRRGDLIAEEVTLLLPPRAGRVTRMVAADMALLLGLADACGAGDVPLMYSAEWASRRLCPPRGSVSRALRSLQREGAIVRGPDIHERTGRNTRTYRRAGR